MRDGKTFGAEVVGVVKSFVTRTIAPVTARIDALEKRIDFLPVPRDGKDVDMDQVRRWIEDEVAKATAVPPLTEDPPQLPDIAAIVAEAVGQAVAALPAPQDGKDADLAEVHRVIADEVMKARTDIGKSLILPELPDVGAMVANAVEQAVAALPAPQDGRSLTVEDVAPLIASEVEKRVVGLPTPAAGKDGVGLAGALIDRKGSLVITLSNGETKDLGPVVGKDADPAEPGRDGFGFDDLDVTHDGARGFTLKFTKDQRVKEFAFSLPVVLDKGVFRHGEEYEAGDGVSYAGSFWIAQEKTTDKPDGGKGWRLAVKRGRDGKPGSVKAEQSTAPVRVGVPVKAD